MDGGITNREWQKLRDLLDRFPHLKPDTPELRAKLLRHGLITERINQKGTTITTTQWPKVVRVILAGKKGLTDTERAELEGLLSRVDQLWVEEFTITPKPKRVKIPKPETAMAETEFKAMFPEV
jgi:hypothetical protein